MARGVPHSDETRAAVLAALLTGQSIHDIAATYHIDRKTIREWDEASKREPNPPQKRRDIGDLLGTYLEEVLTTLSAQARHFREPAWLTEQPAGEAAVLHGVLTDKAIRLLEALQAGESE